MNTAELIDAIRVRFDDLATPYLISTATILEQASLTQTEFARATLALYAVTSGTITANDPWLTVPSNVFVLKTVILNGLQLRPISISELDFGYYSFGNTENITRFANWRAATGTPKFVVTDMYHEKVRLVPSPIANATASLEGYVAPPDLVIGSVSPAVTQVDPQIPEAYHELLLAGTLLRLYNLFDVDMMNPTKAQLYGTQWYQGLVEAQNNLRTSLRRQVRIMELPRGFVFDNTAPKQAESAKE
jgi:hypothetical protein